MFPFNKPCEDINLTVPGANNAEKREILGQDFFLNEIDIDDDSDYSSDEEIYLLQRTVIHLLRSLC